MTAQTSQPDRFKGRQSRDESNDEMYSELPPEGAQAAAILRRGDEASTYQH